MQNVKFSVTKKILTIEVDLGHKIGPSKTGKTMMIATTSGNADTGVEGIKFGLNVYGPIAAKSK